MKSTPNILALLRLLPCLAFLGLGGIVLAAETAEIKLGDSCVTSECHADVTQTDFLHGPLNMKQCEPCHVPIDNRHEFKPIAQGRELCLTCHSTERDKPVVHGPFSADCGVCHMPHGGDNRHFVRGGEGAGSCNICHDSVTRGMSIQHGPVAAGECLICHAPHQSDHKGLLVDNRPALCMGCHVDVDIAMENAISTHEPVAKECAGCHNPHGGNTPFFLPSEGSDLCMSCHAQFIEEAKTADYPHAAMAEGKGCRNCHAPHASDQIGLLSTDTEDLCLSCHSETIERDAGDIDNIAEQLANAKFLHGPVRDNNCVACHQAHGSDFASILNREFPRDFYAPYEEGAYDLCFECHDRTVILAEESDATQFRNGMRNLHFVHVNREKGRTCRACHAEHASQQPHHIRSEVPFGRWMMKINYTKTENGGTCETGCHVPYGYDRVTAVNLEAPQ